MHIVIWYQVFLSNTNLLQNRTVEIFNAFFFTNLVLKYKCEYKIVVQIYYIATVMVEGVEWPTVES